MYMTPSSTPVSDPVPPAHQVRQVKPRPVALHSRLVNSSISSVPKYNIKTSPRGKVSCNAGTLTPGLGQLARVRRSARMCRKGMFLRLPKVGRYRNESGVKITAFRIFSSHGIMPITTENGNNARNATWNKHKPIAAATQIANTGAAHPDVAYTMIAPSSPSCRQRLYHPPSQVFFVGMGLHGYRSSRGLDSVSIANCHVLKYRDHQDEADATGYRHSFPRPTPRDKEKIPNRQRDYRNDKRFPG